MPAPAYRKPVGGITAAMITPAGNLLRAAAAADGLTELSFRDTAQIVDLPLIDDRSTYAETADSQTGLTRVRHKLSLVVERSDARMLFDDAFRRTALYEGLVAIVTAASGEQIVVGWSERLGTEQPLRMTGLGMESGRKPLDGTPATLTLESEDASPAVDIKPYES